MSAAQRAVNAKDYLVTEQGHRCFAHQRGHGHDRWADGGELPGARRRDLHDRRAGNDAGGRDHSEAAGAQAAWPSVTRISKAAQSDRTLRCVTRIRELFPHGRARGSLTPARLHA